MSSCRHLVISPASPQAAPVATFLLPIAFLLDRRILEGLPLLHFSPGRSQLKTILGCELLLSCRILKLVRNFRLKSWTAVLTSALLCALVAVPPDFAAGAIGQKLHSRRATHRKPISPPPAQVDCGSGGVLQISSPESSQGSLLLLELRTPAPLSDVQGTWDGKDIPFWQELRSSETSANENAAEDKPGDAKSAEAAPASQWRALLGVDLELKAGEYPLSITGKAADSTQQVSCGSPIAVREGKFATESLRVAPNFVEPNAEQLARAEAERQRLRSIFATITPQRLWSGSFRVPLDGVSTGGNFGKRRVLNGTPGSPHSGVDFPALSGTPIYAAQRGRVVLAEPLYFSGNTVILDHGLGLYTFYGHMESIDAKVGDLVDTGTLLGKVGATGRVTGPHLHWGLTLNRSRVNPLQLVSLLSETNGAVTPAPTATHP
jgi:murein DD-endopeptidase MepM/ murein hydrolase activator NlpD